MVKEIYQNLKDFHKEIKLPFKVKKKFYMLQLKNLFAHKGKGFKVKDLHFINSIVSYKTYKQNKVHLLSKSSNKELSTFVH
jgi:hypothetical protein